MSSKTLNRIVADIQENYINYDERNVHIWNTAFSGSKASRMAIAMGFYIHPGREMKVSEVFEWIHMIVQGNWYKNDDEKSGNQGHADSSLKNDKISDMKYGPYVKYDPENLPYALYYAGDYTKEDLIKDDSQKIPYPVDINIPSNDFPEGNIIDPRNSALQEKPFKLGHYYLVKRNISRFPTTKRRYIPCNIFDEINYKLESSIGNKIKNRKAAPVNRREHTRRSVRFRDRLCRLTGLETAQERLRGPNYTGFEVAHIFPLFLADIVQETFAPTHPFWKLFGLDYTALLSTKEIIRCLDISLNALLLRGDIHALFDDYQFGIHNGKVYVFEKSGALVIVLNNIFELFPSEATKEDLEDYKKKYPRRELLDISKEDASLLQYHFSTCLLKNVVGFGRSASAH